MCATARARTQLIKELNSKLQLQEFNTELYEHLNKRPEYETSELYSALRKRQDVDDPLYSELKERREMLANAPLPNTDQTPGEVIELVLRALRDVDWPRPGHGVEMLRNYSGPASMLAELASIARLAPTALPAVLTDAGTPTLLAVSVYPAVLTDAGTTTLLALTALPAVLTDAGTPSLCLLLFAELLILLEVGGHD